MQLNLRSCSIVKDESYCLPGATIPAWVRSLKFSIPFMNYNASCSTKKCTFMVAGTEINR